VESPWSSDTDAMLFWQNPPDYVAAAATVDEAIKLLLRKGWWRDHLRAEAEIRTMLPESDRQGICPSEVAKRIGGAKWEHHLGRVLASVGRYGPDETECVTPEGELISHFWDASAISVTERGVELRIGERDVVVRIRRRITPRIKR